MSTDPDATSPGTRLPAAPGVPPGPPGAPPGPVAGAKRSPTVFVLAGLVIILVVVLAIVLLGGDDGGGDGGEDAASETEATEAPETTDAPAEGTQAFEGTISAEDPATVQQVELEAGDAISLLVEPTDDLDVYLGLGVEPEALGDRILLLDGIIEVDQEPHDAFSVSYESLVEVVTAGGEDLGDALEGDFDSFNEALAEIDPDLPDAGAPVRFFNDGSAGEPEALHYVASVGGTYGLTVISVGGTEGDFDATFVTEAVADGLDPASFDPDAEGALTALREEYGEHLELFCDGALWGDRISELCDESAFDDFVASAPEPGAVPPDGEEEPPAEESLLGGPLAPDTYINDFGSLPEFDNLARNCFGGDMSSCDRLYRRTPVGGPGSYEDYGASCGGRLLEQRPGECRRLGRTEDVIFGYSPTDPAVAIIDYGTMPRFDRLALACYQGDFAACDELFRVTPVSDNAYSYEDYGGSCGRILSTQVEGECEQRLG